MVLYGFIMFYRDNNGIIIDIWIWVNYLVGGAITILKNDGVRQWEG